MNFTIIPLFLFFLISLISCKRSEITVEDCQSKDDLELITQSFDTFKYFNIDFLISFTSRDSWGTYSNSIKIFRQDLEYKLESSFVLRKNRSSKRDTTYSVTILPKEKIDSLLNKINQFGCHHYGIDKYGHQIDGNYKNIVYKDENLIKGWMWQDGILSIEPGGERFVDSMKVKALALEGMLYRFSGAGRPIIVYSFDPECENDSIKMSIFPIWGDYISQSVAAIHPKYKFETNIDGYIERNINCRDTVSLAKDLEIIVTTKESRELIIEPKQLNSDH